MNLIKKLFGKGEPEEGPYEPYLPVPSQHIVGLEPIVVQAVENLYANTDDHTKAFEYSIRYKEFQKSSDNVVLLLGLLSYSNGNIEKLLATEPEAIRNYQFMLDEIAPRFRNMSAAEKWVKSITKPQA